MLTFYSDIIDVGFVGSGIVNTIINKIPIELHPVGYQYCGPGTKLEKRLERGDKGINPLDAACKEHDIAYSKSNNLNDRHEADKILASEAWKRVKQSPSIKEKLVALLVTGAMKAKTKLGMGIKKNKVSPKISVRRTKLGLGIRKKKKVSPKKGKGVSFREIVKNARGVARPINNVKDAAKQSLIAVKQLIKGKSKRLPPRIIPIPKKGGILPLVPLFAGLSALGALAGGAGGIVKAVNDANAAKKKLQEAQRHNQTMEAIALRGKGLYLKPYRRGYGLFLESKNCHQGR